MLNYDVFKESIIEKILEFMPSEYADYEVRTGSVKKVNQTLDCLNIIPRGNNNWVATPNIYIDPMYEEYKEHHDLEKVLEKMAYAIDYAFKNLRPQPIPENISELRHTLIMMLVNTENNYDLLKNVPHRAFLDLAVIYKCMVPASNGELGTVLVDYEFMKNLNLTEVELYENAIINTKKLLPITIKKLDEVIGEMLEEDIEEKSNLYIISNDMGINGAINMIYEEDIYKLANNLNSDLFILPSSIHEVIAIPSESENVEWLQELVRTINTEQVSIEERLSDSVYQYHLEKRKMSIVSENYESVN